jgi:hypothetical protein
MFDKLGYEVTVDMFDSIEPKPGNTTTKFRYDPPAPSKNICRNIGVTIVYVSTHLKLVKKRVDRMAMTELLR